jgi:integrase
LAAKRRKRRAPGTGTIRRLPGGRAKASYPNPAGGHWTRNCDTVAEAEAWLDGFVEREKAGQVLTGGQQPLGTWLQTWLDTRPARLKATTLNDYAYKLGYLAPLSSARLDDLTADMIDAFFLDLSRTVAGNTVRQIRALLVRALNEAIRRRYLLHNVAVAERGPRPEQKPARRLSAGNARVLLRYAAGDFYECAYWLMLCCGFRAGEVCGLTWARLDLDGAVIHIAGQYTDVRGVATWQTPKTAAGARHVPIPRAVAELLRAHRVRLDARAQRARRRGTWQEHDLVFPGRSGRPLNPTSLRHSLKDVTDAAKLPAITSHELRHTCAGFLEDALTPEYIIAGILGHGPRVITRHYAPPTVDTMRPWIERVYAAIAGGSEPTAFRQTP